MAIASITTEPSQLVYAGIGNIEAQVAQAGRVERPISYRGIVGSTPRTARAFTLPLAPEWVLAMYSDGVSARFNLNDHEPGTGAGLDALAQRLLAQWGRSTDDATVLLACSQRPPVQVIR